MDIKGSELVQIKKTKFVTMFWDGDNKSIIIEIIRHIRVARIMPEPPEPGYERVEIPINKIPQIIRGLFSAYQRYYRRKVK